MNLFLGKCLEKDYKDRFRDFIEVKNALKSVTLPEFSGIKKTELPGIITAEETPPISTGLYHRHTFETADVEPGKTDIVDLNLSMEDQHRVEKLSCPNCKTYYDENVLECTNCGIIFEKYKSSIPKEAVAMEPVIVKSKASLKDILTYLLPLFAVVAVIAVGAGSIYYSFIESWVDARRFEKQLTDFTSLRIDNAQNRMASVNEDPFRTGKVLIVIPPRSTTKESTVTGRPVTINQPAQIHPAWHKLSRRLRARSPDDVDTLVRVEMELGETGRYGMFKSKVYNTHKLTLKVYDWRHKKYIGSKIIDPVKGNTFLEDEDYASLSMMTSDETIAKYIQSMPLVD